MGKDRRTLSIKELMSTEEGSITIEPERMPRYIIVAPTFSCPLSPYIMWHHGLRYASCPVIEAERDMPECTKCIYRGNGKIKSSRNSNQRHKKSIPKLEKRSNEPIPKIGKTYTSE